MRAQLPRTRRDRARWWRADGGSVAAELTILTPVLIMVLVLVAVVAHRVVDARLRLDSAAHQAARAASIERTALGAERAATDAAVAAVGPAGPSCADLAVIADTSRFRAAGSVAVTVTCSVDLTGGLLLGLPGRVDVAATAAEPIDTYRSTAEAP